MGGKSKGHTIIPSASLIPENDPSVLFTTAGMHPLVPYLMGEKHPGGKRLADVQKSVRTGDIEEVGDATHHTFFEMLGNWSLGDYFKKDAIAFSWEFLTSPEWLGLDPKRLAISVFAGDEDAPRDDEAAEIWLEVSEGKLEGRIDYLPKAKNWWGPAGNTGPCGPDTEMFYWAGEEAAPKKINPGDLADHPKWVEIWNDVFMQYNKTAEGKFEILSQQNVDTGMGLERTLAVVNGLDDNYKTELFQSIIAKIEEISGKKYGESAEITRAMRVIADHLRAASFIMGDDLGIPPSNTGQGYVLRRLIRRAIRYGKTLGIENNFTKQIAEVVVEMFKDVYEELEKNEKFIFDEIEKEEDKFRNTLDLGLKHFEIDVFARRLKADGSFWTYNEVEEENKKIISENIYKNIFNLFQTYGFPPEITIEEARNRNIPIDERRLLERFRSDLLKHQELSRTASAGMFKGGLADAGKQTAKLHTATHLLQAALRQVLGEHVYQKGSNITAERLRFDFSHPEKMTPEEIKKVEDLVNEKIKENLEIKREEMTPEVAKAQGALGVFEAKYGDKVSVYSTIDPSTSSGHAFSMEICGGPHVKSTGELGHFKIIKEEASSAGVRRIKAVLE